MHVREYAHALAPLGACSIDLNYTYFLIPLPAATAKGFPEFPLLKWMDAHTSHTSLHLSQTDSWTAGQFWNRDYKQWILRRGSISSYTLFVATRPPLVWKSGLSAERTQFYWPSFLLVPPPSLLLMGSMWIIFLCAFKPARCVFLALLCLYPCV